MEKILLELNNIEGSIDNIKIIKDLNLIVRENEIHVIMGPNGSGKSTLS
jgi:Fe-S cluster assembly ATPase SufC